MTVRNKAIISITDAAADHIKLLLANRAEPALGVRISVVSGGCSGFSYKLAYANQKHEGDEELNDKGVTVFIDKRAVMYLIGTEMDYEDGIEKSGFKFVNPNETGRCGCGQSFKV
jgi:iron-sulfur cluster assembly protein